MTIRQPIVSVLGHVDHGKTTLLDKIRGTAVADREAGRITQHIGATEMPLPSIRALCGPLMEGKPFRVPGLLFIDTPGHQAFTTLRARGGALADIAVLVVDVHEGLMPQTREAINILKKNKTPFVVALTKIDKIPGWQPQEWQPFVLTVAKQLTRVQEALDAKTYDILGKLSDVGMSADRYDRITDFTKSLAVVPLSARTGEGVPDLLLMLIGLAQRFLEESLEASAEGRAEGTVLEVKEERGLGSTLDAILHNGTLRQGETVVVGGKSGPIVTKLRAILKPRPRGEIRDPSQRFDSVKSVSAAAGIKLSAPGLEEALSGAPFYATSNAALQETIALMKEALAPVVVTADAGIVVKADSLGGLEAVAFELRNKDVPIKRAEVGDVSRRDVVDAAAGVPLHKAVLAFNVRVLPDARTELASGEVKLLEGQILYHLVDELAAWQASRKEELERESRSEIVYPGRVLLLADHVFRVSKPAIVGVRVLAGSVRPGQRLMRDDGRVVGAINSIRTGEETLKEARQGQEVALSIDDVTVGRQVEPGMALFVDIPEGHARKLQGIELSPDERDTLDAFLQVKRRAERAFWGM